jgi:hypothetical protein
MMQISNDADFRRALTNMDSDQQRAVAAIFVEHVLLLSGDERLNRAVKTAADIQSSEDELFSALKSARAATFDSHTRCGSEGNWTDQAGYFVARAAVAAIAPPTKTKGGAAWQAAMSSRMARTSILIDDESFELPAQAENEWQYQTLSEHLNTLAQSN